MKFVFNGLFLFLSVFSVHILMAQPQKSVKLPQPEMKMLRGCEFQVLKGLAEIVEIVKLKDASESLLGHDEYSLKFKFILMEGGQLMKSLENQIFEFYLYSGFFKLPIGPKYIQHYGLKKGQRIALNLLQNLNGDCEEKYATESLGIPNDLSECESRLPEYKKILSEGKFLEKETKYLTRTEKENRLIKKGVESDSMQNVVVKDELPTENPLFSQIDNDLLRREVMEQLKKEMGLNTGDSLFFAMQDRIRAEEIEKLRIEEEEMKRNAEKLARQRTKEEEAIRKEQERIRMEEQRVIQAEIAARKIQLAKELAPMLEKESAERRAREDAMREQIAKELRRSSCVFKTRIEGAIEILSVDRGADREKSVFGYTEYEVKCRFTPENYDKLSKEEKAFWDKIYLLKIDPMGKSANPDASYIRTYEVYRGKLFKGFAQTIESGVCEAVILYAPELPVDASQIEN